MNDLESKLHEMLQDRAARTRSTPQAPPPVVRRARRRQVGTALVSAATAVVVIGGAVLGVQAFGRQQPPPKPAADTTTGGARTVSVSGYGVTYPADWALQQVTVASIGVEPGGPEQPVSSDGSTGGDTAAESKMLLARAGEWLQLSNQYPDRLLDVSCLATDLPADGVALQARAIANGTPSSGGLEPASLCKSGGRTYTATRQSDALVYQVTAWVGPNASETDQQALFAAFASMSFPTGDTGVIGSGPVSSGSGVASGSEESGSGNATGGSKSGGAVPPDPTIAPRLDQSVLTVVAGGTTPSGTQWVMLTDRSLSQLELQAGNVGYGVAYASAGSTDGEPGTPTIPDLDASVTFLEKTRPAVSGSVVGRAARVELRLQGQDPIDVPLLHAPAVTGIDRSYFLVELNDSAASGNGTVVALDADGNEIAHQDLTLEQPPEPQPPFPCDTPVAESGNTKVVPCLPVAPAPGGGSSGSGSAPAGGAEPATTAISGTANATAGIATIAPDPATTTKPT